jgi:sugar lactone lactonase YvrE
VEALTSAIHADANAITRMETAARENQTRLVLHFDSLRKALNDRQQQLSTDVNRCAGLVVSCLQDRRKEVSVLLSQLTATMEETKRLVAMDQWSVLRNEKIVSERLHTLQTLSSQCLDRRVPVDTKSYLQLPPALSETLRGYGLAEKEKEIIVRTTSPERDQKSACLPPPSPSPSPSPSSSPSSSTASIKWMRQFGTKGKHSPRMNTPHGLASFGGELYVVDEKNRRVQVFRPDGVVVRKFGAEGKGMLSVPNGIAVSEGLVYVTDSSHDVVQVYRAADGVYVRTIGSKGDREGQLANPEGIVVHAGEVYVADSDHALIQVYRSSDGTHVRSMGVYDDNKGLDGQLRTPVGLALHAKELYVSDVETGTIQLLDPSTGAFLRKIQWTAKSAPKGLCLDPVKNYLYVTDVVGQEVHVFSLTDGKPCHSFGSTNVGALSGLAILNNQLFVSDRDNHCIHVFA